MKVIGFFDEIFRENDSFSKLIILLKIFKEEK